MKEYGILFYDKASGRYDISIIESDRPNREGACWGGLHCGTGFEVFIGGEWQPTRIEANDNGWYLTGVERSRLDGLRVRI